MDLEKKYRNVDFDHEFDLQKQFLADIKKQFRKEIKGAKIKLELNWHYISGFIELDGKYVYVSIEDLRDYGNSFLDYCLYRVAKHDKDFTGGRNRFSDINNLAKNVKVLLENGGF